MYYRNKNESFPADKLKLGRVLGPIPNEGNEMAQAVLTSNGTVILRRSLWKLLVAELHSSKVERQETKTNYCVCSMRLCEGLFLHL